MVISKKTAQRRIDALLGRIGVRTKLQGGVLYICEPTRRLLPLSDSMTALTTDLHVVSHYEDGDWIPAIRWQVAARNMTQREAEFSAAVLFERRKQESVVQEATEEFVDKVKTALTTTICMGGKNVDE